MSASKNDGIENGIHKESDSTGEDFDHDFIRKVVGDAGRWAYGVVMVEVWAMNESKTQLTRPKNGVWIDPYAMDYFANTNFERLFDPNHEKYINSLPLAPGCGLAGALYAESHGMNMGMANKRASITKNIRRNSGFSIERGAPSDEHAFDRNPIHLDRHLDLVTNGSNLPTFDSTWRDLQSIANDPDQPYDERLKLMAEVGFGWVAGIPFNIGKTEGIVLYIARTTVNMKRLTDPANSNYMVHATLLIGSTYALREPRLQAEQTRKSHIQSVIRRVRAKLKAINALNMSLKKYIENEEAKNTSNVSNGNEKSLSEEALFVHTGFCKRTLLYYLEVTKEKAKTTWNKRRGGNSTAPPMFDWKQTIWTFCGAFFSLMMLTKTNEAIASNLGGDYSIVMGPFGALMTLHYGLTAAPASQPRNAIVGQALSLLIAQSIGLSGMAPWFQQSLATSLSIAMMVKLGVTHPPAGAAALIFSTGNRTWNQVGMMLVGNVMAIISATLLNNMSKKRQYPTFWGLRMINNMLFHDDDDDDDGKKMD